ncbi:hypothetical protein ANN_23614 [Periplaneta americana]|uniref:Uncharacterized protein n=1 Tax=Periplaneta americana TaxID=6978 RepID=A0ABQ8SLK2_PERAM|nr:hypothetical protein ANN_23614 [Periplaneta americana]
MKPSLVQKHIRIRLYNTLARPMLSYGSEAWTLRKADKSRITACEMRFMRRKAGYTKWDLRRNCEILKELKTQPVSDYIVQYLSNWKHHLERMNNSRLPKAIYDYVAHGQRSVGCPGSNAENYRAFALDRLRKNSGKNLTGNLSQPRFEPVPAHSAVRNANRYSTVVDSPSSPLHDGVPPHFLRLYITQKFNGRWIGRRVPVAWPPQSPDLNSLDLWLWGKLNTFVYATVIDNEQTLQERVSNACEQV